MMRYRLVRHSAVAAALWAAFACGCQHPDRGTSDSPLLAGRDGAPAKPTDRQAADVQVAVGRTYEAKGDLARAENAYEEAVRRDPRRADAYERLGIVCDRQGRFQESVGYYRKALQAAPGNADVFCDMGYSLYLQRRWAEAEMNLHQALVLKPTLARAHNNLGLVLAHTEHFDEAVEHFRKGGCPDADARANVAVALAMDERWDDAREQYQKALEINPRCEAARTGLRELDAALAKARAPRPAVARPGAVAALAGYPTSKAAQTPVEPAVALRPADMPADAGVRQASLVVEPADPPPCQARTFFRVDEAAP